MAVLSLMTIASIVVLTVDDIRSSDATLRNEINAGLRTTAAVSAHAVDREMHGLAGLVQSYARRPAFSQLAGGALGGTSAVAAALSELGESDPGIAVTFLADADGTLLATYPPDPALIGQSFRHRDWFQGVTAADGPYVSSAFTAATAGNPFVVVVAAPVFVRADEADPAIELILGAAYSFVALRAFVRQVGEFEGVDLTVTDQRGGAISGSRSSEAAIVSVATDPRVRAALGGGSGLSTWSPDGNRSLSAYAPARETGWAVIAEVPADVALAPLAGLRTRRIILAGLLIAALLAAVLVVERVMRRRRQIWAEVEEAHASALEASRLKSEFLATMSHEIRTPLNGVLGLLEVLRTSELTGDQRQLADTADRSARSLLHIINDVLDLSRLDAGRLDLEHAAVDVRHLVDEVIHGFTDQADAKGLELTSTVAATVPPALRGDPVRMRQVLVNLVGNAVKFTSLGSVEVKAEVVERPDGQLLRVEVADTGIGIAAASLPRLFNSFTQADSSTTRIYGGSGLGLAICKQLVELMDGAIGVRSEQGRGSRFWFAIPVLAVDVDSDDSAGPGGRRHQRVLVVGDDPHDRATLVQTLTEWNMAAAAAGSAAEAMTLLREAYDRGEPFDVGLFEHEIGGMDGIRLAQAIVDAGLPRPERLILMSTVGHTIDARAARRAGVVTWLAKPSRASALYDAISDGGRLSSADAPLPTRAALTTGEPANVLSVLVAEDHPVNQQVARRMLELRGCSVEVAENGRAALDAVTQRRFDVVFMDCQMPEMDGFEATMAIRRMGGVTGAVPIVALTAGAMSGDEAKCRAAGMDAYLPKPVNWDRAAEVARELTQGGSTSADRASHSDGESSVTLDATTLDQLREMIGDDGGAAISTLIDTFLSSTAGQLDAAVAAVTHDDPDLLARSAHSIRGGSSTFGAHRLARLATELERGAAAGSIGHGTAQLIEQMREELARVRAALAEKMSQA